MAEQYKYFAFISFNSKDIKWGMRLQNRLESFKMPSVICSERGWERKPMRPTFFAPTDIQPGPLDEEIKSRLRDSQHLVVICSPNSAKSNWVGREIRYFYELGRADRIHFFIVDGIPHSGDEQTECFHPVVKELDMPEILGANIHERTYRWSYLNRERAYIQLISKLLNVEFDSIWHRHRRQTIMQILFLVLLILGVCAAVAGALLWQRPMDVSVRLDEVTVHNDSLPELSDGEVVLYLPNDTLRKAVSSLDDVVIFPNIPRNMLGEQVTLRFRDNNADYHEEQRDVRLAEQMTLPIERDTLCYGSVKCKLLDTQDKPIVGCRLSVAGVEAVTNQDGEAQFNIPLERQAERYTIHSEDVKLVTESISPNPASSSFAIIRAEK